jgi:hypothetical protein
VSRNGTSPPALGLSPPALGLSPSALGLSPSAQSAPSAPSCGVGSSPLCSLGCSSAYSLPSPLLLVVSASLLLSGLGFGPSFLCGCGIFSVALLVDSALLRLPSKLGVISTFCGCRGSATDCSSPSLLPSRLGACFPALRGFGVLVATWLVDSALLLSSGLGVVSICFRSRGSATDFSSPNFLPSRLGAGVSSLLGFGVLATALVVDSALLRLLSGLSVVFSFFCSRGIATVCSSPGFLLSRLGVGSPSLCGFGDLAVTLFVDSAPFHLPSGFGVVSSLSRSWGSAIASSTPGLLPSGLGVPSSVLSYQSPVDLGVFRQWFAAGSRFPGSLFWSDPSLCSVAQG